MIRLSVEKGSTIRAKSAFPGNTAELRATDLCYKSREFLTSPPSCEGDSDISQYERSTTGYQDVCYVSNKLGKIKNVCLAGEFSEKEESMLKTGCIIF